MNDLDDSMFIPLYLTADEVGSLQAICEGFSLDACCSGHQFEAKELALVFKKLLSHRKSSQQNELTHLEDSWNQPTTEEDGEF
jgi:hypothetical protein